MDSLHGFVSLPPICRQLPGIFFFFDHMFAHLLNIKSRGQLQKKDTQLMIRNYEIGVLFLPSFSQSITTETAFFFGENPAMLESSNYKSTNPIEITSQITQQQQQQTICFPLPYVFPPSPYNYQRDVVWKWKDSY